MAESDLTIHECKILLSNFLGGVQPEEIKHFAIAFIVQKGTIRESHIAGDCEHMSHALAVFHKVASDTVVRMERDIMEATADGILDMIEREFDEDDD